jgi:hypothetical protein
MKFLEAMEMVMYLLQMMEAGNRVQVQKDKLEELKASLAQLLTLLGTDTTPQLQAAIEDLFTAAGAAEAINMQVLPDTMKTTIEQGLTRIKSEIAGLAFSHFSFHDFEPTEEIIPLMREVVAVHYGGVDLD